MSCTKPDHCRTSTGLVNHGLCFACREVVTRHYEVADLAGRVAAGLVAGELSAGEVAYVNPQVVVEQAVDIAESIMAEVVRRDRIRRGDA